MLDLEELRSKIIIKSLDDIQEGKMFSSNKIISLNLFSEINESLFSPKSGKIYDEPIIKEILQLILKDPKSFIKGLEDGNSETRFIHYQNIINNNFSNLYDRINEDKIIQEIKEVKDLPFIQHIGNNYFQINLNLESTDKLFREACVIYEIDNDKIENYIVPSLKALLIYKNLINIYIKHSLSQNEINICEMSEVERSTYLYLRSKNIYFYNSSEAVLIIGSLFLALHLLLIMNKFKENNTIKVIYLDNDNNNIKKMPLFALFNKETSWLKYLILIIINISLIYYTGFQVIDVESSIRIGSIINSVYFKSFKIISTIFVSLIILFNLLELYLIIRLSINKNKDIIIYKYYPKFIKDYLLKLNMISKSPNLNIFLDMMIKLILLIFIMFLFILLLFYIIT